MRTGVVKFFKNGEGVGQGFGFIIDDADQREYFVHITGMKDREVILDKNDRVTFNIGEGKKGPCAVDVSKI